MKKTLALFLCVALFTGLLVGCAQTGEDTSTTTASTTVAATSAATTATSAATATTAATSAATTAATAATSETPAVYSEEIFTTLTTSQESASNPDKDLFAKALKDNFNIVLETEYIAQSSLLETLRLRIAGGEDPDVTFDLNVNADFDRYGVDGFFVPFNEHWDALPNFRAQWSDEFWNIYMDLWTMTDGNLYSLHVPLGNRQLAGEGFVFRQSTLDKLSVEIPTTTEDFYEYLKAIKADDPNSIPMSNRNGFNWLAYGFRDAFRTHNTYDLDPDSGEFVYGPITDNYRAMLIYLNRLYTEDLISKEFSTATQQQWGEQIGQGQVHVFFDYFVRHSWAANLMKDVEPDSVWTPSFDGLKADVNKGKQVTRYTPVGGSAARISSRIEGERLDRMLAALDWLATEEGQIATQFGEEGVTYTMINGEPHYTDKMITPLAPDKGEEALSVYNLFYRIGIHPLYWYYQGAEVTDQYGKYIVENNFDYNKPFKLDFTDDEQTIISDIGTVVGDLTDEYAIKFVMGQLNAADDAAWDEYISSIKKGGLDQVLPIYSEKYFEKYGN